MSRTKPRYDFTCNLHPGISHHNALRFCHYSHRGKTAERLATNEKHHHINRNLDSARPLHSRTTDSQKLHTSLIAKSRARAKCVDAHSARIKKAAEARKTTLFSAEAHYSPRACCNEKASALHEHIANGLKQKVCRSLAIFGLVTAAAGENLQNESNK